MAIYYLTILGLTISGIFLTEKRKEHWARVLYLLIAFLALTALASFRYAIGFDYFSYRRIYEAMAAWNVIDILQYYRGEPLFKLICKLFASLGFSYTAFLVAINVFIHAVAMWFIYRFSKIPWLSVYLYITFQFLAHNMNLIRQSIAVSFFLLAYPYLRCRRFIPYVIIMIAGGLFHNSLFFVIPAYFLFPMKHTWKSSAFLLGFSIFIYVCFDSLFILAAPYLPARYSAYQGSFFWNANSFIFVLLPFFYCLLIFMFRKRMLEAEFENNIYINSALYTFLINLFITKHFILERFSVYPFILSIIAVPEIFCLCSEVKIGEKIAGTFWTKRRVLSLFMLFGGVYFMVAAYYSFHNVYPYVSLLDKVVLLFHFYDFL